MTTPHTPGTPHYPEDPDAMEARLMEEITQLTGSARSRPARREECCGPPRRVDGSPRQAGRSVRESRAPLPPTGWCGEARAITERPGRKATMTPIIEGDVPTSRARLAVPFLPLRLECVPRILVAIS